MSQARRWFQLSHRGGAKGASQARSRPDWGNCQAVCLFGCPASLSFATKGYLIGPFAPTLGDVSGGLPVWVPNALLCRSSFRGCLRRGA
eukprot:4198117-Pyramimonas_sp.AAC.1